MSTMLGESKYERIKNDAYMTPPWCVHELVALEEFTNDILDPCCGTNNIVDALNSVGYMARGQDLYDYGQGKVQTGIDFLARTGDLYCDIITNPPYSQAVPFIEQALKLTRRNERKVAMLLRNEFDSGHTRRTLFAEHAAFRKKIVLTKRPKWSKDDKASPRHNFSWFIWDWKRSPLGLGVQLEYAP